jgi:alpha-glucosidase/alpha-D-xyloside xylohydrolase
LEPAYAAEVLPKPADLHNPQVELICRKYLNTRYQLLPYIYSAIAEGHQSGMPLMRSLWLHYPDDRQARALDDTYMFGDSLLVAPVLEPGALERKVYLPRGIWWDFWTSERVEGGKVVTRPLDLETLPVYVKAGTVLPTGPVKQFAHEPSTEPVKFTIYPGADGQISLYEDDSQSFAFERGEFTHIDLQWTDASRTLIVREGRGRGVRGREIRLAIANGSEERLLFDGKELSVRL